MRKLDHRHVDYKKKAVRMMSAIILTFLICRLPFTALIIYRNQSKTALSSSSQVQNTVKIRFLTCDQNLFITRPTRFCDYYIKPSQQSVTNIFVCSGLSGCISIWPCFYLTVNSTCICICLPHLREDYHTIIC